MNAALAQVQTQVVPDWYGGFQDLSREHGFEPLRVEGTLPADLRGTLYRNGPSLFSAQGRRYHHWFDGDGAVSAVQFGEGKAQGAVRVIQSAGLLAERQAHKQLFATYGTVPGRMRFWRKPKNNANTSVMLYQGKLLALMEGGLPTQISTDDFQTLGESNFEGVLTRAFTAHPHRISERQATYAFSIRYGRKTELEIFELPDQGAPRLLALVLLPRPTMIHDFIATPRHLIFFVSPLKVRLFGMLLALRSFSDSLEYCPELGTEIVVVPIDAPQETKHFTVDAFYQWHFANAFERQGQIVVDVVRYPDFASNAHFSHWMSGRLAPAGLGGTHCRMVVKPAAGEVEIERHSNRPCEFPQVAPGKAGHPQRYAYAATWSGPDTRGVHDGLSRLEVETGRWSDFNLGEHCFPSEPIFVPRPNAQTEEDGYVLALVYDAARAFSFVAVFDAARPGEEALARAYFNHPIPYTFHGTWAPKR